VATSLDTGLGENKSKFDQLDAALGLAAEKPDARKVLIIQIIVQICTSLNDAFIL